ncbi:MAG: sugar phosphate isomerase/epimerase [Proteobacteria bacterium]|nr:sugar phosphate isomerase/epimerase [Desulfobacula sp.]MBU3952568.1 sugar phosphate isomerase/epimerase [Pseudomonadota bacterium]MBU4133423.1 sugar phosphate isomerase/epimerase [Pseudomonadota bacterium]
MQDRPFRLCTTSFIYPDHIIPNVRRLGPFFDEIELLVFESMPKGVLPSRADIRELGRLSGELNLTYNVHLPTDISLTDPSDTQQSRAADTLLRVIDLLAPLNPTTHTLHLPMDRGVKTPEAFQAWETRARKGLERLVPSLADPARICLETLWYAPGCLGSLVTDFGLALCVDAGHHFKYGHDLGTTFAVHRDRIPVVHLHGVDFSGPDPKDHTSLDRLPSDLFSLAVRLLADYGGTVSLEVFNLENLTRSLAHLSFVFADIPTLEL